MEASMQRTPAVAGRFYPEDAASLRQMVEGFLGEGAEDPAIGLMVPHAGYVYSGGIAGLTFAQVNIPARVVLLGPDHHGVGHGLSLAPEGQWRTPLGICEIDRVLHRRILQECPGVLIDPQAHRHEHSLEVQIPFIQVCAPAATIVPIVMGAQPLSSLLEFGTALGRVLAEGDGALLVASSDLTHYESAAAAEGKDRQALQHILQLDAEGLYHTVRQLKISMCGVLPVVVMLAAASQLGARRGRLVRYGHSGETTGDRTQVVGYAGVIVD
jgi:MEMO1 family protein